MSDAPNSIRAEGLSADIHPLGAELCALRDAKGRDLLWGGDPSVWSGRAPLLFPIIGNLVDDTYRLPGHTYHLGRHGFARNRLFHRIEATDATALFRLSCEEATLAVYPFRFELDVRFALAGATLTISAGVKNLAETPMPASFGFHPAFRWPLPYGQARAAHAITFDHNEPAPVRRLTQKGTILAKADSTPVTGKTLALRDDLFTADALILDQVQSRRLWYGADSGPRLKIDFPDTPYLGLWTKPRAHFICIEPWHGHADPEGFTGDLYQKPGIFRVAPGGAKLCTMAITLEA